MKKIKLTPEIIDEFVERIRENLSSAKGIPEKVEYKVNPSVSLEKGKKAKVVFTDKAWNRMWALVSKADKEIGWYGVVEREDEKTFIIKDILLCPQQVDNTVVKTDDLEFSNWSNSLDDDTFNHMRFYGHSHVRMGTSPSGTDTNFQQNTLHNINDFYIFGIFNKNDAYWFNIFDVENNILYENADIEVEYYMSEENVWAEEQIKEFVTEYTKPDIKTSNRGYSNNYDDIWKGWRSLYEHC